ncbi:ATP-binding cassette domain-containing protein [Amycolatopsis cihanbeyliensis]|uniref:ABC-2 type transport system ATP-binding protein n=1 Tax=Amycolatopsis cihanbeyliensis TaxID=1128664 RepID=A0A542DE81_AMYCI|nr:ATP-binding cassette domain-containing protein [Amycolatopsis cihanbeyliensis]TQJ01346.1 ABC-2 type transport system ATP-binding protein [Amycolatopsis cihanbeyliensis]
MTEPVVEATEVGKTFGDVVALDRVSIQVPPNTVLGLLGHNGAGKTTLINILTTMITPSAGTARVAGFDVVGQSKQVRRRIGLTGQLASVDEDLTGRANLVMIARLLGATRRQARTRAAELLEVFGLTEAADRAVGGYSGGMRRRLDLAAGLVGLPQVVFLDEPTTGLDPGSRAAMWEIVQRLVAEGTTVLLTTQYLDEADRLADSIVVLSRGRVTASGTPTELKSQVGQQSLSIRLRSASAVSAAFTAIRQAGFGPSRDDSRQLVVTPLEHSSRMAAVVRALDDARIEPAELALTEPTLDDVYLALTGSGDAVAEAHSGVPT